MKYRFARNYRTHHRELQILSQRGETLNTRSASWLTGQGASLLLGITYDMQRDGVSTLLHYDIDGLWSLKTYLAKTVLSKNDLSRLLLSVREVLQVCADQRQAVESLIFDPNYVFVDARYEPHYVYVPLDDTPFETRNSPLTLLKALANHSRLKFANAEAELLSRNLEAFVLNQNSVFSANLYRRFLEQELQALAADPQDIDDTPKGPAHLANGRSGTGETFGSQSSDSLFWTPLGGSTGTAEPTGTQTGAVLRRARTGEEQALPKGREMLIGRGSACDVRALGNPKISRKHAALMYHDTGVSIQDLGSANGTWIGGRRLAARAPELLPLDGRFKLADEEFEVRIGQ